MYCRSLLALAIWPASLPAEGLGAGEALKTRTRRRCDRLCWQQSKSLWYRTVHSRAARSLSRRHARKGTDLEPEVTQEPGADADSCSAIGRKRGCEEESGVGIG